MKDILLREKRRHGLKEEISEKELELLKKNVPIQKIMGFINFDDVHINVQKNVLIPRYETEEVMRYSLKYITKDSNVLDMCTGSGYIGLSIKKKIGCNVVMSDISSDAIEQSKENAIINGLDVSIIQSDMFHNIHGKFDLIISNPPYIPKHFKLSDSVINHEPINALYGGDDGNKFYKILIKKGFEYLKDNGIMILEISIDNFDYITSHGFTVINDINEKPRIAYKYKR